MVAPKKKAAPKKLAPKRATTTTRNRPQLDKMSPGTGYTNTKARYYLGDGKYKVYQEKISGATADRYNAEDAYYSNPANIPAMRKRNAVTTKGKPRGGK